MSHLDYMSKEAQSEREECTAALANWLYRQTACRTPEAARSLAERILSGDREALLEDSE
jgi:hypothetical protein